MKKFIVLLFGLVFLFGCISDAPPATNTASDGASTGDGTGDGTGLIEDITDVADIIALLEDAGKISEMSYSLEETYTIFSTGDISEGNTEYWIKGDKIKSIYTTTGDTAKKSIEAFGGDESEDSFTMMVIKNGNRANTWNSAVKEWNEYDAHAMSIMTPLYYAGKALESEDLVIVESATLAGRKTTVVEFTNPDFTPGASYRFWVWNENGVSLKMEDITTSTKTVQEVTNLSFDPIDDSVFEAN